jgi:hypothetical protein
MKAKHTPGPWFTRREGFSTIYVEARIRAGVRQEVAACGPTEQGSEQQEANADLIAEAGTVLHETGRTPRRLADERAELLEALKAARRFVVSSHDPVGDELQRIDAAIAKATTEAL